MTIARRSFITGATAATAASLSPFRGWAKTSLSLGQVQIDTLSDGYLIQPGAFALGDLSPDAARPILARYGITPDRFEPPCNVTLLRDGTNTVLFDVGSGPDFVPTAGTLMDAFDTLGITPDDITHVVFTHTHADHLWGLLDDFDDLMFPDAQHMIGKTEFDYWTDPETVNNVSENRVQMAVGAKRRLDAIEDQIITFRDGEEILPGIMARATFGHTPGHMSFQTAGGAMILGDAVVNHHLAFERPDWHAGPDQDPDLAAQTRVSLLDQLAAEHLTIVGFHLPNGGIGHTERNGDSYRFVPDET